MFNCTFFLFVIIIDDKIKQPSLMNKLVIWISLMMFNVNYPHLWIVCGFVKSFLERAIVPLNPDWCVNVSEGLLIALSSSGLCNVFWQTDSCELCPCLSVSDQLHNPLPSTTVTNTDTQTQIETRNIHVRETLSLCPTTALIKAMSCSVIKQPEMIQHWIKAFCCL